MPKTREITAATIRITSVISWQASQRKTCSHKMNPHQKNKQKLAIEIAITLSSVITVKLVKKLAQKLLPFFRGYLLAPKAFALHDKSASSP
jgi:hypothetical protein